MILENIVGENRTMVIPKTIVPWSNSEKGFFDREGVFLGDIAKFVNPDLTPYAEEIIQLIKSELGCSINFVSQYSVDKIPEYLKGCNIIPHSRDISRKISEFRVYIHPNRFCTFEMLPAEAMSSGIPVCYVDMPQSLNQYIGNAGIKYETPKQMISAAKKVYNSLEIWNSLNRAGISKGASFGHKETAVALGSAIERKLDQVGIKSDVDMI